MPEVDLEKLLAAGAHFGHQTHRWNPKMKRYIFGERNRIHIINLKRTQSCLIDALESVRRTVASGKTVLFVGTKTQAKPIIREEAARAGQFYVTERWLGGMLTNFRTIRTSITRLKDLDKGFESGEFENRTKKEQVRLRKERDRLEKTFSGIKDMNALPGIAFVVDTVRERIAVSELNRLEIPVIGIVDTNADPDVVSHPVPGNDDAIRSIKLFASFVAETAIEATPKAADAPAPAEAPAENVAAAASPSGGSAAAG